MIKNAPLTILDEPDTALDKETKDYTIDFFRESKNTVIVISHNSQWEGKFENKTININIEK
ncbi:ABC transporter ATP-binding protein [Hathewaya massiliensis]|uniref:ATP-binding cassette domain-containing protein n=1 Tax=Hathewaya massiliensis TaxID=1964382 RepID=UPI00115A6700|nr:ABC transporter ATP-binding protein [Hathewaya massiliensis]